MDTGFWIYQQTTGNRQQRTSQQTTDRTDNSRQQPDFFVNWNNRQGLIDSEQ
jgi:hypothetical protein